MQFNNSNSFFKKSLDLIPGGVHSPVRSFKGLNETPIFMNKANGPFIYDEDNNKFIDFCMSFGPMILGHNNKIVREDLNKAIERGWSFGTCEKYSLELADYIIQKIPFIENIRFMNSGTEAVMTALRLARGFTKKNKIIKFDGCYHGHSDSMLIKSGSGVTLNQEATSSGISPAILSDTLVCKLNSKESVESCFELFSNDIAAVIIEPLPANYGLLPQEKDFLNFLRTITKKFHSLLIFDEVISGFRVSFGGMSELLNITPDIITYGKIIGGGLPVGAVAGKKEILSFLSPLGTVYQAGTLSANPLAMIAGLSTLKQLTNEFYNNLNFNSLQVVKQLDNIIKNKFYDKFQIVLEHSLFWVHSKTSNICRSIEEIPPLLNDDFKQLFSYLLSRNIYLAPNGHEVGFISSEHNKEIFN